MVYLSPFRKQVGRIMGQMGGFQVASICRQNDIVRRRTLVLGLVPVVLFNVNSSPKLQHQRLFLRMASLALSNQTSHFGGVGFVKPKPNDQ